MKSYTFDIEIDSTNYNNIVIRDKNLYPIFNTSVASTLTSSGSGNGVNGYYIEVTGAVTSDILYARFLRIDSGIYAGKQFDILGVSDNTTNFIIYVLQPIDTGLTIDFTTFKNVHETNITGTPPDNSAIGRSVYSLLAFIKAKPSEGDFYIPLENLKGNVVNEWAFTTDDGGWHQLDIYAVKKYVIHDATIPGNPNYKKDEIVWDLVGGDVLYYLSLVDNNSSTLDNDTSWELLTDLPTPEQLFTSYEVINRWIDNTYRYYANTFIVEKLIVMTDKLNAKMDCNCSCADDCTISDNLKLAMYIEQIYSLIRLQSYGMAQTTYEKALQLVQDKSE